MAARPIFVKVHAAARYQHNLEPSLEMTSEHTLYVNAKVE